MKIETYDIFTTMGKTSENLPFLTSEQLVEFNEIGYSGKDKNGNTEFTHSIGHSNKKQTVLTESEFCKRITYLRNKLRDEEW